MILTQEGRHVVAQLPLLVLLPGTVPHKYFIVLRTLGMMAQSLSLSLSLPLSLSPQLSKVCRRGATLLQAFVPTSTEVYSCDIKPEHVVIHMAAKVNTFVVNFQLVVEFYQVMQPTIYKSVIHKCILYPHKEMGRACSAYGEKRSVYRVLVGKPDGNRPLGRHRRRWHNSINL